MSTDFGRPIITCALTGGVASKRDWPSLPEQPDEIVEQGIAAWRAGAAVLHIHARDLEGRETCDLEVFREIHTRLCAETDAIIQISTGAGPQHSYDERLHGALLNPEMCSLNMGYVVGWTRSGASLMLANPRPEIERFAREMRARGVSPEHEIYNVTMLEELELLVAAGLTKQPINVGLVLNTRAQGGARGTWQNLADMVRQVPPGANVDVIAIGESQLPLTTMALAMGLNVRVGLEDNVFYRAGEPARDNAQLVERTVRIARELELEPATPAQARERLGTRGRERWSTPAPVVEAETPVTKAVVA
jgi:3-keto-5-aminohexanoate cleavage enzyme